jgi:hypothetical protein
MSYEPPEAFYKRKQILLTVEDLIELEQVGWPHIGLSQSRELAALLREGLVVAADCPYGCCPPVRYVLE